MEIIIYTDGGCQPNPGLMSIGVVCYAGNAKIHQIAKQCGPGTSNQAELLAIREALLWAPHDRPIRLYVDSKYAEGLIVKNWEAMKNLTLVEEVRALYRSFPSIRFQRVNGHQGIPGNEWADRLCRQAR